MLTTVEIINDVLCHVEYDKTLWIIPTVDQREKIHTVDCQQCYSLFASHIYTV